MTETKAAREEWGEEYIEHLRHGVGFSEEEINHVLADDDLWMVMPESRFAYLDYKKPEDAVAMWKEAADKLDALASSEVGKEVFGNFAVSLCIEDAALRAREAECRARRRLEEAAEQ